MLEIKSLDDIRGNNIVIYSIKTLLEQKCFPKLSIMSGVMGVGKTSVAKLVAQALDESGMPVVTYNCGVLEDMGKLQEEVFALKPAKPKAFIFEELHSLSKANQNALLQMFDSQAPNVFIICTTTELYKVLRTIRSRARVWEFRLLSEKQLAQLLDDYLVVREAELSAQSKQALLRSCRGVPRDLISNIDFALDGKFSADQLNTLLGNISDELLYAVFCSMKSNTVDFVGHIEDLMDDPSVDKVRAITDFWLRFLLERVGGSKSTLTAEMLRNLNKIFSAEDISKVTRALLRTTPDTLMLELVNLNMQLVGGSSATVLGQQRDEALVQGAEARLRKPMTPVDTGGVRATLSSIKGFKL